MASSSNIEQFKSQLETIYNLVQIHSTDTVHDDELWKSMGSKCLIFIDKLIVSDAQITNALTPKEFPPKRPCILTALILTLNKISNVNEPFTESLWSEHQLTDESPDDGDGNLEISFYELAYSRFCAYVSQLLGDKTAYIQKLLIKNLFSDPKIGSLFASDVYMFLMRLSVPASKAAMCNIIMNLCKFAPPEALTMGAAIIKRAKHPVINFENPNYEYILDFNSE